MASLPILDPYFPNNVFAWRGKKSVMCRDFLSDVGSLAPLLPEKNYAINVCEDRYWFLVGFAAALSRGQTTVLPQNRTPSALEEIRKRFPFCYSLTDFINSSDSLHSISVSQVPRRVCRSFHNPMVPETHMGLIAFTSGTTGQPRPCPKTWQSLVSVSKKTAGNLCLAKRDHISIVATVPPQHMYGLETSIMLPLQHGWAFHSGLPFFPEDVRSALEDVPSPRVLITTPIHIRACVADQTHFPELECIISATAPLPFALAAQAEKVFKTQVLEIYGFAEAGTLATRRPVTGDTWKLLKGMWIETREGRYLLHGPHLQEPVFFPDDITPLGDHGFVLGNRNEDVIKIGGHRISLMELNSHLLGVHGVEDGVFLMPELNPTDHVTRVIAFVVTKKMTAREILTELRKTLNPVFLPRPLYVVSRLPRNATGKLPREALLKLAQDQEYLSAEGSQDHTL